MGRDRFGEPRQPRFHAEMLFHGSGLGHRQLRGRRRRRDAQLRRARAPLRRRRDDGIAVRLAVLRRYGAHSRRERRRPRCGIGAHRKPGPDDVGHVGFRVRRHVPRPASQQHRVRYDRRCRGAGADGAQPGVLLDRRRIGCTILHGRSYRRYRMGRRMRDELLGRVHQGHGRARSADRRRFGDRRGRVPVASPRFHVSNGKRPHA